MFGQDWPKSKEQVQVYGPFGGLPQLHDGCSKSSLTLQQGVGHSALKYHPVEIVLGSALVLQKNFPKFVRSASPAIQVAGKRCLVGTVVQAGASILSI